MPDELEVALEGQLRVAKERLAEAEAESDHFQKEADAVIERARKERTRLLGKRDEAIREAKVTVNRLEKAQKVLHGEPLNRGPYSKSPRSNRNGTIKLDERRMEIVKEAIEKILSESEGNRNEVDIIVADVHRTAKAAGQTIDYSKVRDGVEELRRREQLRRAGTTVRGSNTVQLYRVMGDN